MKMTISKFNNKYEVSFDRITQLCGRNIPLKTFLIDSIAKHFSYEKYKEYEEGLIDNISLNGEVPGRKQWECTRISSMENIVSSIQMNKSSILGKCLKEYVGEFDCQNELMKIDDILLDLLSKVNDKLISSNLIELQYEQEDLFSMIQQTTVRTKNGQDIHELSINELFDIFFEILRKQQQIIPEKRLYIFENIDHLISVEKYQMILEECEQMAEESNIWFVFSTSLPNYIYLDENVIEYVNIINDEIFNMPSIEHIADYLEMNYPIEGGWDDDELYMILKGIGQLIGCQDALVQPQKQVILKLINKTIGIKNIWEKEPKSPEIQCLLDENMV